MTNFLKKPEAIYPGTKMPGWEGIFKDDEYAPLAAYLTSLAKK